GGAGNAKDSGIRMVHQVDPEHMEEAQSVHQGVPRFPGQTYPTAVSVRNNRRPHLVYSSTTPHCADLTEFVQEISPVYCLARINLESGELSPGDRRRSRSALGGHIPLYGKSAFIVTELQNPGKF